MFPNKFFQLEFGENSRWLLRTPSTTLVSLVSVSDSSTSARVREGSCPRVIVKIRPMTMIGRILLDVETETDGESD